MPLKKYSYEANLGNTETIKELEKRYGMSRRLNDSDSKLVENLENDTKRTGNQYPLLFSDTIIKNGKLIEKYNKELETLNKEYFRT